MLLSNKFSTDIEIDSNQATLESELKNKVDVTNRLECPQFARTFSRVVFSRSPNNNDDFSCSRSYP